MTPRHLAACAHRRGQLTCIREPHPHAPRGHVYRSTTGTWVPDRHTEPDQEAGR